MIQLSLDSLDTSTVLSVLLIHSLRGEADAQRAFATINAQLSPADLQVIYDANELAILDLELDVAIKDARES